MASVYKRKDPTTGKPKRGDKWRIRFKDEVSKRVSVTNKNMKGGNANG